MRGPNRSPLPDLALLLEETNRLLATNGLPMCHALAPVSDGDTADPVARRTEVRASVEEIRTELAEYDRAVHSGWSPTVLAGLQPR